MSALGQNETRFLCWPASLQSRTSEMRMKFDPEGVARALRKSWSVASARQRGRRTRESCRSGASPALGQKATLSVLTHCPVADLMQKSPNANTRLRLPMTIIEHLERCCGPIVEG